MQRAVPRNDKEPRDIPHPSLSNNPNPHEVQHQRMLAEKYLGPKISLLVSLEATLLSDLGQLPGKAKLDEYERNHLDAAASSATTGIRTHSESKTGTALAAFSSTTKAGAIRTLRERHGPLKL